MAEIEISSAFALVVLSALSEATSSLTESYLGTQAGSSANWEREF